LNRVAITVASAACFGGCVFVPLERPCRDGPAPAPSESDSVQLVLIVAAPFERAVKPPYMSLGEAPDTPVLHVSLEPAEATAGFLEAVPVNRCKNSAVRIYNLDVDPADWSAYWEDARTRVRHFTAGLVFPGLEPPLSLKEFGFSFVNRSSQQASIRCGCLAR